MSVSQKKENRKSVHMLVKRFKTKSALIYEKRKSVLLPLFFSVLFGGLGLVTLYLTQAASTDYTIEPETGTLSGSAVINNNASASNGSAVKFVAANAGTWKTLKIGAGGFLTGIDMSKDGTTRVVRTDTYGAYLWQGTEWKQLVTKSSMPAEDILPYSGGGVFELSVSPSNANRLYMAWQGSVYKSDNKGSSWTKTSLTGKTFDGNDGYRVNGRKMVVDPINPDVVYFGIPSDGVYVTTNAGSSWSKVASIPVANAAGYSGMAFYENGGQTGGKTKNLFVPVSGGNVYRTTDAGATWASIGGLSDVQTAIVSSNGAYYATSYPNIYRYKNGSWSVILANSNGTMHSVAVDPNDPMHIVLGRESGEIIQSYDEGSTWTNIAWGQKQRVATDIPWLAWTDENFMSNGFMMFDLASPDKLWFAQGIGVWYLKPSESVNSYVWQSQSAGIEQLVVNDIISPPGGKPLVAVWDRGHFRIEDPDQYPTKHGPTNAFDSTWDLDYSGTTPSFLVANSTNFVHSTINAGYSTDGGITWQKFASMPANAGNNPDVYGFGGIAVGDANHIVWMGGTSKWPYYTANRGASWQPVTIAGLNQSTADLAGFQWGMYLHRHTVASDKVNTNTFYMLYVAGNDNQFGFYRSTDGGANWTMAGSVANNSAVSNEIRWASFNAELQAVPGKAGHLFFTPGHSGTSPDSPTPADQRFLHSTDGGVTWTAVANGNVKEVYKFGYGKAKDANSYPSIYIMGWVNNQYGVWRSDDEGSTWTKIGDYPNDSLDSVSAISGDMNTYGTVYIGMGGSGVVYFKL